MKRLLHFSWKHLVRQLGLLDGIAAAFVIGTRQEPARADDEPTCLSKPNIMPFMDYSTSMDNIWDNPNLDHLSQDTHYALLRVEAPPTQVQARTPKRLKTRPQGESEPTPADGRKLDVPWFDARSDPWYECNGAAIGTALDAAGDPINGSFVGVGSWAKDALFYAKASDHPAANDEPEQRVAVGAPPEELSEWSGASVTSGLDEHPKTLLPTSTSKPCLRLVERPPEGPWSPHLPSAAPLRCGTPLDTHHLAWLPSPEVASGDGRPLTHRFPPVWMPHRSDLDPRLRLAA